MTTQQPRRYQQENKIKHGHPLIIQTKRKWTISHWSVYIIVPTITTSRSITKANTYMTQNFTCLHTRQPEKPL